MEPEEKKSSHTKRNIFLFIIFILLFGGIYILWLFLQSPAIGVIRTSSLPKEEAFDTGTETKQFVGTSFSFSYPGRYKERAHTLPEAGPVEESIFLSATDVEGKKITLTLRSVMLILLMLRHHFRCVRTTRKHIQSRLSNGMDLTECFSSKIRKFLKKYSSCKERIFF